MRRNRQKIIKKEQMARAKTGIRRAREIDVFSAPKQIKTSDKKNKPLVLKSPRNCYICKAEYTQMHFFYDSMCPSCADFNYQKRFQTVSLKGQTALIMGSRMNIGYQAALMMLRAGAQVISTTPQG